MWMFRLIWFLAVCICPRQVFSWPGLQCIEPDYSKRRCFDYLPLQNYLLSVIMIIIIIHSVLFLADEIHLASFADLQKGIKRFGQYIGHHVDGFSHFATSDINAGMYNILTGKKIEKKNNNKQQQKTTTNYSSVQR